MMPFDWKSVSEANEFQFVAVRLDQPENIRGLHLDDDGIFVGMDAHQPIAEVPLKIDRHPTFFVVEDTEGCAPTGKTELAPTPLPRRSWEVACQTTRWTPWDRRAFLPSPWSDNSSASCRRGQKDFWWWSRCEAGRALVSRRWCRGGVFYLFVSESRRPASRSLLACSQPFIPFSRGFFHFTPKRAAAVSLFCHKRRPKERLETRERTKINSAYPHFSRSQTLIPRFYIIFYSIIF